MQAGQISTTRAAFVAHAFRVDSPPMRVGPSIPINVARAYGVGATGPARGPAGPATPTQPITPLREATPDAKTDDTARTPSAIDRLIGGTVPGTVEFETATRPAAEASSVTTFQLYTRAADRIEAAVGVQIGRAIDVRG